MIALLHAFVETFAWGSILACIVLAFIWTFLCLAAFIFPIPASALTSLKDSIGTYCTLSIAACFATGLIPRR